MFWALKHRYIAGIEMHFYVLALETIDKSIHLHWRHEIAVEENIFDVERYLELFSLLGQRANRLLCPLIANIVCHRFVVGSPRDMHCSGNNQHIFDSHVMSRLGNHAGQFKAALPLGEVVTCERIRPK